MRSLKSNIWKVHLRKMLTGFTLFTPVIVLFFQENGLSMTEIAILQAAFSAVLLGLEIPSGFFADLYGRRTSLTLSGVFLTAGIIIYSTATGFTDFFLAEIVFAVGASLESGATSAMMYDTLEDLEMSEKYQKVWGMSTFYGLISVALASILGGFIGEFSLRATIYGMIPFYTLLIPLSLSFREPSRHRDLGEKTTKSINGIMKYCFNNRKLRWLIIYSAVVAASIKIGYFLYQPYFKLAGLEIVHFGLVFAGLNIVSALASKTAHQVEDSIGVRNSLGLLMLFASAGFLLMGQFLFFFSFAFAGIHSYARGFSKPVISDYVNRMTDSSQRSTVLSTKKMASRLLYIAAFPAVGILTDAYGYQTAFNALAISVLLGGSIAFVLLKLAGMFEE
jgi:MFS family permease